MSIRWLLIPALLLALILGCSENTNSPTNGDNGNITDADSIARYYFMAMSDSIRNLEDAMDPPYGGDPDWDYIEGMSFATLRAGFNEARNAEADNGLAHLGLAVVEMLELNYDADLWEAVDSLDAMEEDGGDSPTDPGEGDRGLCRLSNPLRQRLLGREYQILAEAPLALAMQMNSVPGNLSVPYFQDLIVNSILPELDTAIAHAETADNDLEFEHRITFDDETVVLDLGEAYAFCAGLYALRAGLKILTAYNMDLYGEDGTYDWLLDEDPFIADYERDGGTLNLYYLEYDEGVLAALTLKHQLTRPGSDFMTLRSTGDYSGGTHLAQAHDDLETTLGKLEAMVDYIYAEEGSQEDDVIVLGDLDELLGEVQGCEDCPEFMQAWTSLQQMIAWGREVLTTTYELRGTLNGVYLDLTVNASQFFNDPVADWKTMLPNHRWLESDDEWQEIEYNWWEGYEEPWDSEFPFVFEIDGEEISEEGVNLIRREFFEANAVEWPVEFLNAAGSAVIDHETEMPHFPNYELGGVFPGMTRGDWVAMWEQALDEWD